MFRIDAPGFSAAELFWAGGDGKVLPGWTSFACEPLRDGRACLVFPDSLAVPEGASAVLCRAVSGDGRTAAGTVCLLGMCAILFLTIEGRGEQPPR